MKKLKFLPSILMLVLCVGVLAVGIYAIKPSTNAISGTITIGATNSPVMLEVFIDSTSTTAVATYDEVRGGETINLTKILGSNNSLAFDTDEANELNEVPSKKIIVRVTNLSTTNQLCAYYLNSPLSSTTLIQTYDEIYGVEDSSIKVANVTLPSYTILDPNDAEKTVASATQELTIEMKMATWEQSTGNIEYYLYIEDIPEDENTYYEELTGSQIVTPSQAEAASLSTITASQQWANTTITSTEVANTVSESNPNIVVPEGVAVIDGSAFAGVNYISTLVLPSTLTTINESAFSGCAGLTEINIPKNVTHIGDSAFADCTAVTKIFYDASDLEDFVLENCVFNCVGENGAGIAYI